MSTKPRRRSAITALFAAAIALLLILPSFSMAKPLGSVALFKEGLRPTARILSSTAGSDGNVWFVDNKLFSGVPAFGKITPTGTITEYISGTNLSGLIEGSDPSSIATGPDGKLWFTDKGSTPAIGVIDPTSCTSSCTAEEFPIQEKGGKEGAIPQGIVAGPDGNLWFADAGTTKAIGTINPSTHAVEEFSIQEKGGNEGSRPQGIVAGPDGKLWFTDTSGTIAAVGKINPSTHEVTEFATGAGTVPGGSNTFDGGWGIAAGSDGNVWFTNGQVGSPSIDRVTPSGEITSFSSGLVANSRPYGLTAAPDGKLWFTDNSGAGTEESQTITFSGATAGQEFKVCTETESSCAIFKYVNVASSANRTALRNAVKAALETIYGAGTVSVGGGTTSCGGNCALTVSFEGSLEHTNIGQTSCVAVSAGGTCTTGTNSNGAALAIDSITTSGTITMYPINGLTALFGIAYNSGSVWFDDGFTTLEKIGRFGIEPSLTLKVNKTGSGTGTVTSLAPNTGINCGSECSKSFESGKEVELEATAETGFVFAGWSGGGCSGTGICKVKISGFNEIEVSAQFNKKDPTNLVPLTVKQSGNGTVSSKPKGIKCGATCSLAEAKLYKNTVVTLEAKPGKEATFTGWSETAGTCTGTTTPCQVTLSAAKSLTAAFSAGKAIVNPKVLTLTKAGTGKGTVKASGLTCEADCAKTTAAYYGGVTEPKPKAAALATLKQVPAYGSVFGGWSGCTEEKEGNCIVSMSAAKEVTAEYTLLPTKALSISRSGNGTVSSKPKGIKCGATCSAASAAFPEGAVVTLEAKPGTGATFTGWSETAGTCTGTTTPCQVTLSAAKSLTAAFSAGKAIVNPKVLTLTKAGSGFGTVKASGLTCEVLCTSTSSLYYGGVTEPKPKAAATVTLIATSAPGSKTVVWSGCGEEKEGNCIVSMSAAKAVTATFDELE